MNGMKAFLSFMMIVMISSLYREEDQQQLEDGEQSEEQIQERWATEEEDEEEEPGIQASLWMIGAIHLVLTLFFLLSNVTIIACNGLLTRCWKGMVPWRTNPISKLRPIKTYFSAAIPLSVGYLFKYCEFQLLFLFAVIMGPAEVAAWGLLGAIWRVTEGLAIAISTASKIRVANLLGSGRPYQAKYSSEKSLFWSVLFSSALSTVLGIFQSDVPRWFTHDETLQELVEHEIPLLCLGVALMSFASMAWAHLCAQGRSYLASGVAILGSILITLPLVLVSTFYLSYGLQGLLTAMILGYAASAFVCTLLVLTSNWTAISRRVMKWNYRRQRQLKEEKKIDEVGNRLSQK
jgi:Na+-driven multidrug efflux pump